MPANQRPALTPAQERLLLAILYGQPAMLDDGVVAGDIVAGLRHLIRAGLLKIDVTPAGLAAARAIEEREKQ